MVDSDSESDTTERYYRRIYQQHILIWSLTSVSSSEFLEKLRKRVIKNFMDILILTEIKKGSLSGYDVIGLIHRRFGILVSSGTVYSLLYSMERDGLIKGSWNKRKRVYTLTEKGQRNIKVITKANAEIQKFLRNILKLNTTQQSP